MELSQIRSDIDALLEEHRENWMNFVFGDKPDLNMAMKEEQVCQAMLIMATINTSCLQAKNPKVSTHQEGWDLRFTWKYKDQYFLSLTMIVPWEGQLRCEINTFEEGDPDGPMRYGQWHYEEFTNVQSQEVRDFAESLKFATERDTNESRTGKETIR